MKKFSRKLAVLVSVVTLSSFLLACSLAPIHGYFHQVTAIRGRVVGRSLGPFQFRWLRQSFGVDGAHLSLYEYRWPAKLEDLKLVSSVNADAHGNFDFGPVRQGHYILNIGADDSRLFGGMFEVEVTDTVRATKSVTIDVSPIHPDCRGGHEFIETKA
ncbi:MAG TPA: hypothetical protein VGS27_25680 [Candidatus Sulfotelmatobacter sp.]|nr:hypothetical protein [Candidatus Sulfotelmatobacter sp.]